MSLYNHRTDARQGYQQSTRQGFTRPEGEPPLFAGVGACVLIVIAAVMAIVSIGG